MIKVIKFNGGVGNQMFQYAFYLALKKKHPFAFYVFDTRDCQNCHNGFELWHILQQFPHWRKCFYSFIVTYLPRIISNAHIIRQEDALTYYEGIWDKGKFQNCIFDGFWQTEKYFQSISIQIRNSMSFRIDKLSKKTLECLDLINNTESVSIHIRRGDYIGYSMRQTFGLEYYRKAIDLLRTQKGNIHLFVFSDDILYVKKSLPLDNATYVDWNTNQDSWQDMFLMSKCKHNIIANSSFSWWGAWLNNNKNKVVIAPKLWFVNENNNDVVPSNWIRI